MNSAEKEILKELLENTQFVSPSLLQAKLNIDFIKAKEVIQELHITGIVSKTKVQYRYGIRKGEYGTVKFIEQCYVREVYKELVWAIDMLWNE